jgi:dipeptidyl aminopeptidase/acylaminoacyl peptidase
VIVHPEANHEAREMRGVLHDLAREGYFAVAADYRRRRPNGLYRNGLFVWRHPDDPRRVLDLVRADPRVDPERVAGLGFSQGGVYSLLIAANTGQLEAVVAYYSLSDFETWFQEAAAAERAVRRFVFRTILLRLRKESGAREEGELREVFRRASPLRQAERIEAPVLLIHGDRDTSAPLAESLRLQARLVELGREVDLLVVEDAGHVFNFKNREQARQAWEASLGWLDRHLGRPLEEEGTAEPAR